MIDTSKHYSEEEAAELGAQGYSFVSVQMLGQRDPTYIVAGWKVPIAFSRPQEGFATQVFMDGELIDSFY